MLAAAATATLLALAARRLIGGQTGDILGASQQLAFAAALSFIA
ncbi:MAG: adenosylcobinamide-GDP ribazoletransferase [Paracoccaceae bacterium]